LTDIWWDQEQANIKDTEWWAS